MGPNQTPPPSGNFNPQQYDFITNPAKPQKSSILPLPGKGGSTKQRLIFIVLAGLILLTILILVLSLIFGGKSNNTDQLLSIAKQQTELIRVAEIGQQKAGGEEAKSLAISAKLTITSQQTAVVDYLKSHGKKKVSSKDLSGSKNSETDSALSTAETNGRFDEAFTTLMNTELKSYQDSLQQTFDQISGNSAKQLLSNDYSQIKLLLDESN